MEVLQLWKRQKGKDATNRSLLGGIERPGTLNRQLIEVVVDMMKKEHCLVQEVGDSSLQAQEIDLIIIDLIITLLIE